MTAGGQMTVGAHSQALSPTAFGINVSVMAMGISRSYPYRMGTGRLFPPASLPVIFVSFIAVVATYPHVIPAGTRRSMFVDANWGSKFYDDLRMRHTEAQRGSDECVNKDFHISPGYVQAGTWPMRPYHR